MAMLMEQERLDGRIAQGYQVVVRGVRIRSVGGAASVCRVGRPRLLWANYLSISRFPWVSAVADTPRLAMLLDHLSDSRLYPTVGRELYVRVPHMGEKNIVYPADRLALLSSARISTDSHTAPFLTRPDLGVEAAGCVRRQPARLTTTNRQGSGVTSYHVLPCLSGAVEPITMPDCIVPREKIACTLRREGDTNNALVALPSRRHVLRVCSSSEIDLR